jgi:hypothetical protein
MDVGLGRRWYKTSAETNCSHARPGSKRAHYHRLVKDKEVEKVLKLFPAGYQYYFTNAHSRAMPAIELKQKAAAFD